MDRKTEPGGVSMSALRDAVLLQMRLRGFATNTVDAYIHAMVELWKFFKRPLERLTCEEVQRFLDEVITVRKRAWATVSRIKALCEGQVTYSWRDRREDNIEKTETIPTTLFTRRFLAHILPDGFHKIRYFGWMAATHRKEILAAIRKAIPAQAPPPPAKESLPERILRRTGVDITLCPHCGKGHMQRTDRIIMPHRGQSP
jgi:hypothetical protein